MDQPSWKIEFLLCRISDGCRINLTEADSVRQLLKKNPDTRYGLWVRCRHQDGTRGVSWLVSREFSGIQDFEDILLSDQLLRAKALVSEKRLIHDK